MKEVNMFKIGDIVVHKRDICKVTDIIKNYSLDEDYYSLVPIDDSSLTIHTPISNTRGSIRKVISKAEAEALIQEIPKIEIIEPMDDRALEGRYISLINSSKHEDLIRIIKTTYLRREERENCGKKVSEKDKSYFRQAEKLFYSEFSIALGKSYQETKDYIVSKVAGLAK